MDKGQPKGQQKGQPPAPYTAPTPPPPERAAFERGADEARALLADSAARQPAVADPSPPRMLAIGDSWFAYWPRGDLLDVIEARGLFKIDSLAWAGCTLAELFTGRTQDAQGHELAKNDPRRVPQTQRFVDTLRAMPEAQRKRLTVIAVSAGGNDVAGDPATIRKLMLDFKTSGKKGLDPAGVAQVIGGRMRDDYARLIGLLDAACRSVLGHSLPIVLHGYDYPVPDGRPALREPWLQPTLEALGYTALDDRRDLMKALIDALNAMQADLRGKLAALGHPHLHHIALTDTLCQNGVDHRLHWQNELHPSIPTGFALIADRFIEALRGLDLLPKAGQPPA